MGFLKIILKWILSTLAITITSYVLPFIEISGDSVLKRIGIAFIAGLVLGIINLFIKPVVKLFALPVNILTLGLFNIIINAGMLWIVDYFVDGFKVSGFWGYIWSSLLISIITVTLSRIFLYERKGEKDDKGE
ncbi:MAG: phage holin family protein [Actinobacteria bacterium]|nr:phage holin family protein [Actinomycetota bacterium]